MRPHIHTQILRSASATTYHRKGQMQGSRIRVSCICKTKCPFHRKPAFHSIPSPRSRCQMFVCRRSFKRHMYTERCVCCCFSIAEGCPIGVLRGYLRRLVPCIDAGRGLAHRHFRASPHRDGGLFVYPGSCLLLVDPDRRPVYPRPILLGFGEDPGEGSF